MSELIVSAVDSPLSAQILALLRPELRILVAEF
jgi:hypothetical protein